MRRHLLGLCLWLPACALAEVWTGHVTHVSDGDTLWIKPANGSAARKVRLLGLDAPEICQPGGVAARAALRDLVADQPVQVRVNFQDSFGRDLAHLLVAGRDVGALLVGAGHAWASRWHGRPGTYAAQEVAARASRQGVFADPAALLPSDFRKRHGSCQTGF